MAETLSWQVSTEAAEIYQSCFVPAIFDAWAGQVAEAAGVADGDRVLDVACGTGVLAQAAQVRVGASGHVTGLDINEAMLAVAARVVPEVSWKRGDAGKLPFGDACFDAVVSQFALMYFPDRIAALREMWRVLAPGGKLAVAVWAPLAQARGYKILVDVATRHCGTDAAGVLASPFVLGDSAELGRLFLDAGISAHRITARDGLARFPSVQEFVRAEVRGSPLAESISDEVMDTMVIEAEESLAGFVLPSGEIVMPVDGLIVTASKD